MDFRILGPLEVRLAGGRVEVQGAGQRALLARLLLDANRVVASDRLLAELWVVPPRSGVKALQQRVVELRRGLEQPAGGQLIHTHEPGYVLELEPDALDLHRFETLLANGDEALQAGRPGDAGAACRSALELWRGPPLAEFPDAPFATEARARLEELYLVALGKRLDADLALGRHGELIGELKELAREHRFREGLWAQLILALYRAGRQAEALETYRETRRILADELGVDPTRELRDLEQAILRQDASLDLPQAPSTQRSDRASHAAPAERSILIAPSDRDNIELLLAVGEPLTRRPPRELILTALAATAEELQATSSLLEGHREALLARGVSARAASFTSDAVGSDLVRLAGVQNVDLLLTDAPAEFLTDGVPPDDLATIFREAPCDVATVVPGDRGEPGVASIVVPFGATDHDWAALEISAWLAVSRRSTLTLLGSEAQPERGKRDASRLLADVSLIVQRATGVAARPVLVPPGEDAILRASRDAGFLVVGLSDRWADEG
ncbi:MAG: BTAD domain-containing putative transcriptional regulator, partial [Gaiellales bacterium]